MTSYAFEHRRLDRLYAHVIADNPASRRVLENNGFEEEGRLREHAYIDGRRKDVLVYGLVRSDKEARGRRVHSEPLPAHHEDDATRNGTIANLTRPLGL